MNNLPALTDFCMENRATNNNQCNKTFKSLFNNKVLFPKLEKLQLSNLNKSIPSIWDDQLPQSSFSNLKILIVEWFGFVKLVPFHVLKSLNRLEELEVRYCYMLEVVFDFEELNNHYKETQSLVVMPLKRLKLQGLPKLNNVWGNAPQGIVCFHSVRQIHAYGCKSLKNIFPASIAKDMLHLEELQIDKCGIEVIVAKDQDSEAIAPRSVFPRLTFLYLDDLPNLRNFYPHRHTSEWPHLQRLSIGYCEELEIFENEASSSSAICPEERTLNSKYPLLFHKEVIPNLEELRLWGKEAEMLWNGQFPSYPFHKVKLLHLRLDDLPNNVANFSSELLKRFPKLEELVLRGEIEEIFSSKDYLGDHQDDAALVAPFRKLKLDLYDLRKAKHIWNEHSPLHVLQNLQYLCVENCHDLISLAPSFISLATLTHLHVTNCMQLTTLLTSSTARSLVNLTWLRINDCKQIEEVVTKQQGEDDEEKDIVLTKLEYLGLYGLPSLNSFCSHNYTFMFPSLYKVCIEECPRFTMFCPGDIHTPLFKGVGVAPNQKFWDTNLNNTTQHQFTSQEVPPILRYKSN